MQDKNLKGHAALLVAYIIFGLNIPVVKVVFSSSEVSAIALTFFRMAGAALLFWITSLFTKREAVVKRDLFLLFLASLFGVLINQITFIEGLSQTSPVDAGIIATMAPLMTMILAAFFLKEPVTWKKVIGVFIGATGALLLILNSNESANEEASIAGNFLCVLSGLSFAIYLTLFKQLILRYSAVTLMKWMFLFATVCYLPLCWQDVALINYAAISFAVYLHIAFVVTLATFFSYMLIPVGQKLLRPTIVSMYNYLQPVVSSIVAIAIGIDSFGWVKGGAATLVFIGVYVVTSSKSRAQMDAEKTVLKLE
ncbi:MAG: DMT family transporter [Dysgonamonadaceae bacterium]|jgi:drug/metabolite transporter (DMT)-like permease|nr:DMT family transporter [Dysgonamonadaceae bacterium]